jgi:hypothetical protein
MAVGMTKDMNTTPGITSLPFLIIVTGNCASEYDKQMVIAPATTVRLLIILSFDC